MSRYNTLAEIEQRGPKWMALAPQYRRVLDYYLDCHNQTEACRLAGYQDGEASGEANGRGKGAGLRVQASRIFGRLDVKEALLEEIRRRISINLPLHVKVVEDMALFGIASIRNPDNPDGPTLIREVKPELQFKAAELMMKHGGMRDVVDVNLNITVKSDSEKLTELRQMVARGEIPASMLDGITITDAEYEDVPQLPDELKDLF